MDAQELAKVVSALLAPCLPYLLRGAGQAGRAIGNEASKQAHRLWAVLKPKLDEAPSAAEAAREVANAPEDPDAQAAFRLQLRKLLAQDPALLEELSGLWREIASSRVGQRIVTIGGGVSSSTVIAGDSNTLITSQVSQGPQGLRQGPPSQVEAGFTAVMTTVHTRKPDPNVDREEIEQVVGRLRDEVARGGQASATKVERWLRFLAETAPDVLEEAVTILLDPVLGASPAIQDLAGRYRAHPA